MPSFFIATFGIQKSKQACNAIRKTNQAHINIFKTLHPTQKINPASLMDSTFKIGKCIPC
jgi:hypothetical protein